MGDQTEDLGAGVPGQPVYSVNREGSPVIRPP